MQRPWALVVVICALASLEARADCSPDGIRFFPGPGAVIPTNARIIIEGVGTEQRRVAALVGREVVFKSSKDLVAAHVRKGWRSDVNRVAVIAQPSRPLKANTRYTMLLGESLPDFRILNDEGPEEALWDVGRGADLAAPRWLRTPAVSEGSYSMDNGKISRFVKLEMVLEDDSPVYLVVTLQRSQLATAGQTYFAPVRAGIAIVGHDGCSGGFSLESGRSYRAMVQAYDSAGNAGEVLRPIELQAPGTKSR